MGSRPGVTDLRSTPLDGPSFLRLGGASGGGGGAGNHWKAPGVDQQGWRWTVHGMKLRRPAPVFPSILAIKKRMRTTTTKTKDVPHALCWITDPGWKIF